MYSIDKLRAFGRRPRLHPNGFIQFDIIPSELRLNVWTPEPLRSKSLHPIHNHSFDIASKVICGMLTNITYGFIPADYIEPFTTVLYQARRLEGSFDSVLEKIKDSNPYGFLRPLGIQSCNPGESYTMPRETLHDSIPHGLTATLMHSIKPNSSYGPIVALPFGVTPDNDHRREDIDERILWEQIDAALMRAEDIEKVLTM